MNYTLNLTTTEQTICDLLGPATIDFATSTSEQIYDYLLMLGCDLIDLYWFNQNHLPAEAPQIDKKAQGALLVKVEKAQKQLHNELMAQRA